MRFSEVIIALCSKAPKGQLRPASYTYAQAGKQSRVGWGLKSGGLSRLRSSVTSLVTSETLWTRKSIHVRWKCGIAEIIRSAQDIM